MKAETEQRLAVHDGPNTHYFYVGDHFHLLRTDGVTIVGTIVGLEKDTVIIKRRHGERPPWPVKVEDIKAMLPDNTEQVAADE